MAARGVEDRFGDHRWTSAAHRGCDAELFEVPPAFGRDEFAAQFWSWEFFLFDEEHAKPAPREMYRRTRSRRPRTGDDDVEIVGRQVHRMHKDLHGTQDQTIWEVAFQPDVLQFRTPGQGEQLIRFETAQYR